MSTQRVFAKELTTRLGINPKEICLKELPKEIGKIKDPNYLLNSKDHYFDLEKRVANEIIRIEEGELLTGQARLDKKSKTIYVILGKNLKEVFAVSLGGGGSYNPGEIISGTKNDFILDEIVSNN